MKYRNSCKVIIIILTLIVFIENGMARNKPPFIDPKIVSGEKSTYKVIEDGKTSQSFYKITREQHNGKDVYIVRSKSYEMILQRSNLRSISVKKKTADGKLVFSVEYTDDRVHFIYPGPKRNKVEKVPEDRYDVNAIIKAVRGFPFDREKKVKFTLVTPDHIIGAYIKIDGSEKLTVPAGSFDCYKLEAGIAGFKGKIIRTKFYFWIEKKYPYRLIKYTDSDDSRLMTLVSYEVLN